MQGEARALYPVPRRKAQLSLQRWFEGTVCLPWAPEEARAEVSWACTQPGSPAAGCSAPGGCAQHRFWLRMSPVRLMCLHGSGWCWHR